MEENKQVEETTEVTEEVKDTPKTFTQEEVEKMLQSETDRKVSKALETAKSKWTEEYKAQLEHEKKLAAMTEEEKFKHELDKQKSEFQKQLEQFEEERKAFQKAQLESEAMKVLANNNLPVEFASFVMANDAETIHANIETLKTQFSTALDNAISERLKGSTPKISNVQGQAMTKADFGKLTYAERAELMKSNPDLVNRILKS